MNYLLILIHLIIGAASAQETEIIPTCSESHLLGKWVGPDHEMEFKDDCKMETGEDFDDSKLVEGKNTPVKIGDKKCQVFEKKNVIYVDCDNQGSESFHRYKDVVNK